MSADPHTSTGAYAAHALSGAERLAFERHLEACPACAREVRELTATAARLGAAVATLPPADLWDRVRAEAGATRQLPPILGRADRRGRVERGVRLGGRRRFPPLLAAAAALLVAAVSVAVRLGLPGRSGRSERSVDLVAAVLGAPDARRVVAGHPGRAGQAAVVVSRQRGQAVFVASSLVTRPRRPGPTSSGWWAGRGRARRGWSRPAAGAGSPGCWTGR
jgi:hypothetical protein